MSVKVCWHMDGSTNSLERASDRTTMAGGVGIPDDDTNLTGDGCADNVRLLRYLEVIPDDNWRIAVDATGPATTPPTASARPTASPSASHPTKTRHHVVATPSSVPSSSCYPLTNGGNCYEPGEFCRHSDAGASGVAGDGESIVCEDNNGLRWEPA